MTKAPTDPRPLADADLDDATGGIGMLLPAVQDAREAARWVQRPTADKLGNFEIQD